MHVTLAPLESWKILSNYDKLGTVCTFLRNIQPVSDWVTTGPRLSRPSALQQGHGEVLSVSCPPTFSSQQGRGGDPSSYVVLLRPQPPSFLSTLHALTHFIPQQFNSVSSEYILCVVPVFLSLLRLALGPQIWLIFVNVPFTPKNLMYFVVFGGVFLKMWG